MDAYCIGLNANCVLMFGELHVQKHVSCTLGYFQQT